MDYPWCFKLIIAPFQDAYFISKIGRRKTWVIATSILLCALWAYASLKIEAIIVNVEVVHVTVLGTIVSTLLALQDVSMDG